MQGGSKCMAAANSFLLVCVCACFGTVVLFAVVNCC
jgi:hypothetical protein